MTGHERLEWLRLFRAGPDRVRIQANGRVILMFFGSELVSYDSATMKLAAGWVDVEDVARAAGVQAYAVKALREFRSKSSATRQSRTL